MLCFGRIGLSNSGSGRVPAVQKFLFRCTSNIYRFDRPKMISKNNEFQNGRVQTSNFSNLEFFINLARYLQQNVFFSKIL